MFVLGILVTALISYGTCDEVDGGKAPRIRLNDDNLMPAIGLGTFQGFDENGQKEIKEGEVELPVSWALAAGYRMIDTSSAYHNEEQVGRGIARSGVPREHVFIVTKLGLHEQRHVVDSLKASLKRLNTSYVDLYLIHNPVALKEDNSFDVVDYLDTWKAMEEVKQLGLARSIGISNFNVSQMERLLSNCRVRPAVLQVEVNLNLAQHKIHEFTKREGIALMAYTPFGSLFDRSGLAPPPRVDDAALGALARSYNKTVPQVALRYLVQRGIAPIPKSVREERLRENIDIFDFSLTADDMTALGKYNKDYRVVWPSFWQEHPFYPFERKDKPDADLFKPKPKQ